MPPEHGGGGVVGGVSGVGAGAGVEVDEYFFLQPLSTRRRRALLRASGVRRIDGEERHQLRALRGSREECGCRCRGACDPETCACSLAGIKCQVNGAVVRHIYTILHYTVPYAAILYHTLMYCSLLALRAKEKEQVNGPVVRHIYTILHYTVPYSTKLHHSSI